MDVKEFKKLPLLGIVRGIEPQHLELLLEAVIAAGLRHLEITMNTAGASELIKQAVKLSRGRLTIGAGTVLTMDDLKTAVDSGATFIVSPVLVREVVSECNKKNIAVFPGAFTPQEIYDAWQAGATMVKVFPALFFGPAYFKEIRGPFADIELMATGGVRADNIKDFFASGASAAAFGGSIFSRERLQRGDFHAIEEDIRLLLKIYLKQGG